MRFVAVKSAERQASALVFRTRDLLVRQRTQAINALRSHLAEFGMIAPKGPANIAALAARLGEPGEKLPIEARIMLEVLADTSPRLMAGSPSSTARSPGARVRMRPRGG